MLSQISPCCLLGWLNIIWIVPLPFSQIALYCLWYPHLLTGVDLHYPKCTNVTCSSSCVSSQVFHWLSWRWLHVIFCVSLSLTGVALCHFICPFYMSFYMSSLVFHFCLLESLSIASGVLLLLSPMLLHHLRCPTVAFWDDSASFQVFHFNSLPFVSLSFQLIDCNAGLIDRLPGCSALSSMFHCHSLEWLCVVLGVLQSLTRAALFHFGCSVAAYWDVVDSFQCLTAAC